jgi:methionyl-tRNA formyltransferase
MNPVRLVFMGTPELARTVLAGLAEDPRFQILAVVVQPDKPTGRGLQLTPPPVKVEALARGLPVLQPLKAREPAFLEQLRVLAPDLIAVAAYGQILPQALLDIPRHGCVNVHTSLLPRWRGAAPIQWAVAEGDAESGVTLMRMEAGLDTGPMIAEVRTPIHADDTGQTLHDRLAQLGGQLLCATISAYIAGELPPRAQPAEGVTYARKITKDDGRLDWSQPAVVLGQRLRAFTPWPGAFAFLPGEPKPKLLKVHAAVPVTAPVGAAPGTVLAADKGGLVVACAVGALRLTEVQPEGGRRMRVEQFLAGHRLTRLE